MAILKCASRPILVDRALIQRTYLGVLEGRPNSLDNDRIIRRFVSWVEQSTGYDVPHVIQPQIDESKGHPRLPEYACAIELTSSQPAADKAADMSYAVVVWFQSENPLLGLPAVPEMVDGLKWSEIARDGQW